MSSCLRSLRKSEHKRKARWKRKQANNLFNKNPCLASKRVLNPRCFVKLSTDKNIVDQHKSSTVFDPFNSAPLPPLVRLPPAPPIYQSFASEWFCSWNQHDPYKVYKLCPNICDYLFRLFKSCFKNCVAPVQWRIATDVFMSKSDSPDPNKMKDFRPVSLLNVEGKFFFSILSKRLVKHIYSNKLINSSIQKGCMEKVPGCWEHMSVVWGELKSRKKVILLPYCLILLMPMDLYHTSYCFLPFGVMVFKNAECLCLLSIMRACGVSAGLIQLLLVGTIT